MADILGNIGWVAELIPDLSGRLEPFTVDTDEVDDELIEVFIDELKRLTDELQQGLQQNDQEMIRMAAHSIKGMGGTIGLPELSVLGLEIENMAKEDRFPDTAPLVHALAEWMATFD
jgi:HPt (histidine-containing phosphotransfer) domain-containing protein